MLIFPAKSADALSACPFRDVYVNWLPLNDAVRRLVLAPGDPQELVIRNCLDKPVAKQRQRQSQRANIFTEVQLANRFRTHGSLVDQRTRANR